MAGLPNFGSSFADALISTMGALDARKRSQREERQWAEEDAMKQALKNATQEGQVIGVRGEPVGRFANEAEADAAMKSSTPEALRNTRVTMAPSPTAQMPAEDISKVLGIGALPSIDNKGRVTMSPSISAPLVKGNIDTSNRPHVVNPDGSVSTVRTVGFGTDKGTVNVPTVSEDGRIMSNDEAFQQYKNTGRHLGIYKNDVDAERAAQALHLEQQAMLNARGEDMPTIGEEEDARLANLVKFKDKSGQWLVADKANARTANKYDVMAERAAIYQQYGKDDMALQLQSRAEQMLERDAARNQKAALRILNTTGDINGALKKLSENDDVTLGANLQMMKNPDGTFSIGAAPDGTGLPPKALPGLTAKSPEDLRTLLNGVISDNFLGAQQMIFNQMVSLKDIEFKAQAQALAQKKFEFDVKDADRRFGLAVKESNRRGAAGGEGDSGFYKPQKEKIYGTDADGKRVVIGEERVKTHKKTGQSYSESRLFGWMPAGYDWDRLGEDMIRTAGRSGFNVTLDGATGLPAYVNKKTGKKGVISERDLAPYRR